MGTSSITYDFSIERAGERCVTAAVVTALRSPDGGVRPWPEDYRRLLTSAGPQAPELLVIAEPQALDQSTEGVRT